MSSSSSRLSVMSPSRLSKCPRSPLARHHLAGAECRFADSADWRNSWLKCRCLLSATASSSRRCRRLCCHCTWMQMAANGATARDQGCSTGGCLAHSVSSGPSRRDSPPAQGGVIKYWAGLRRTWRRLWTSLRSSSSSTSRPSSSSWMRLRFSSSTDCCRFQLLHRDRYAQCKLCRKPAFHSAVLGVVVDMPGVYNDRDSV